MEVGDVGPGGESFAPRTGDYHATHLAVGIELAHQGGQFVPHVEADGVVLSGAVEGDCGQRRLAFHEDIVVQDDVPTVLV